VVARARQPAALLARRDLRLAVAEGSTGGALAAALTAVPGSSQWFDLAVVAYSNSSKERLLGVSSALLDQHGAVSLQVAEAMARGVLAISNARLALAETSVLGPGGGRAQQPVGSAWLVCQLRDGEGRSAGYRFEGGREAVRTAIVGAALELITSVAGEL